MIDDPLGLLARSNPVPATVTPRPFDELMAQIDGAPQTARPLPAPPRRGRLLRFAAPALAVGVVLVVAAAAILLIHHHAQTTPAHRGSHATPAQTPPSRVVPPGGMRGGVSITAATFSSRENGVVSLQQCIPCARPSKAKYSDWIAATRDGGHHWKVVRVPFSLVGTAAFSGQNDGWAIGSPLSGPSHFYVTHDGGSSWAPARLVGAQITTPTSVSVAGATAWTIGYGRCSTPNPKAPPHCVGVVQRGPASGSTLTATPGQPEPNPTNGSISAVSSTIAYVTVAQGHTNRIYVTNDAGQHWAPITTVCRTVLVTASSNSLWDLCNVNKHATLARSVDGGHHWQLSHYKFGFQSQLTPVSATTAWAVTSRGVLVRSTDGGRTWHSYVYPPSQAGSSLSAVPLGVLSANSATAAFVYSTGHDRTQILVERAIGAENPPSFIKLPPGLR